MDESPNPNAKPKLSTWLFALAPLAMGLILFTEYEMRGYIRLPTRGGSAPYSGPTALCIIGFLLLLGCRFTAICTSQYYKWKNNRWD